MMCSLFYACTKDDVGTFFVGLSFFLIAMGLVVVLGLWAYWDCKARTPPVTTDDINSIIDAAKRRAYERARYE